MNIREYSDIIQKNLENIKFSTNYGSGNSEKPYLAKNLSSLRDTLNNLSVIDLIQPEINAIKNTSLFSSYKDEDVFTSADDSTIKRMTQRIRDGLEFILNYVNQNSHVDDEGVFIKLPEFETFDDLSKISNDFKKGIEIPINDQNEGGKVNIISAETGSIWLTVSLGALSAVNLIGAICWAAAVVRRKHAEAKIFEQHARTLDLKNDSLELFVQAQKTQVGNILQNEAEAIVSKHYTASDPEIINRLKMSITTISDLIDKGSKILPTTNDNEVKKLFPDYNQLSLIESSLKQLMSGKENSG